MVITLAFAGSSAGATHTFITPSLGASQLTCAPSGLMRASVRSGLPKIIDRGINVGESRDSATLVSPGEAGGAVPVESRLSHADNVTKKAANQIKRFISIFPSGSSIQNPFIFIFGQYSRPFTRLLSHFVVCKRKSAWASSQSLSRVVYFVRCRTNCAAHISYSGRRIGGET